MPFYSGIGVATEVMKGTRRGMLQKPPKKQIVAEALVDDSESTTTKPAPTLPKLKKTANVLPTWGTAAREGTPASSKKQAKEKGKESDKAEETDDEDGDEEEEEQDLHQVLESQ